MYILFNLFVYIIFILVTFANIKYTNVSSTTAAMGIDIANPRSKTHWNYEQRLKMIRSSMVQTSGANGTDEYNCNSAFGLYLGSVDEMKTPPDCNDICGSAADGHYVSVKSDDNTLINGVKTVSGYYCLRANVSVIQCNTMTSDVVRSSNGAWSCHPKWPNIFGGIDGNDIMVCGGYLDDGGSSYVNRIPDKAKMKPISNPYTDLSESRDEKDYYRFKCTPGKYTEGPEDYMMNRYITVPNVRLYRMRNGCAKYISNALDNITYDEKNAGFCKCLPGMHGPLRIYDSHRWYHGADKSTEEEKLMMYTAASTKTADTIAMLNDHFTNTNRRTNPKHHGAKAATDLESIPYACSPCINTIDLTELGIINAPRACVKGNRSYINEDWNGTKLPKNLIDIFPCGKRTFDDIYDASCINARVLVSRRKSSYDTNLILKSIS